MLHLLVAFTSDSDNAHPVFIEMIAALVLKCGKLLVLKNVTEQKICLDLLTRNIREYTETIRRTASDVH